MKKNKYYIGTCGYTLPQNLWWNLHLFNSLEIDGTFYRQPKPEVYSKWYYQAPDNFLYSPKMNRYMTHFKRLIDADIIWQNFWFGAKELKEKIGVILFQFPANFKNNKIKSKVDRKTTLERLIGLEQILPENVNFAFEFRHSSWFTEEVYKVLERNNWALVNVFVNNQTEWFGDLPSGLNTKITTADFIYIRLHGSQGKFFGRYSKKDLELVFDFCQNSKAKNYFIYFNNDAIDNNSCLINKEIINVQAVCDADSLINIVNDRLQSKKTLDVN